MRLQEEKEEEELAVVEDEGRSAEDSDGEGSGGCGGGGGGGGPGKVEKESRRGHSPPRTETRSSVSRTREPIPVFALPSYRGWRPPLFRGVADGFPLHPSARTPAPSVPARLAPLPRIFRARRIPPRAMMREAGARSIGIRDRRSR